MKEKLLLIKGKDDNNSSVIKLFLAFGATNPYRLSGKDNNCYYFINELNRIDSILCTEKDAKLDNLPYNSYIVYSIDEFYKMYPYNIGDFVHYYIGNELCVANIHKMKWDSTNALIKYLILDKVTNILLEANVDEIFY